jgi:uncharacterized membrane protein YjfL (UPF0719 family)
MEELFGLKYVVNALIFSTVGLGILAISFVVFDKITPGHLWKEIVEEQNIALSIVTGAFTLAMAVIIASAIHG